MASKYVSQSAAAKSLSCYIILKRGKRVATVTAHFGNYQNVLVNIFQTDAAQERSRKQAEKDKREFRLLDPSVSYAGQYSRGSDLESALHGLYVDGHCLVDHSGGGLKPANGSYFPLGFKAPRGYSLANYNRYRDVWNGERVPSVNDPLDSDIVGYGSCFRQAGLRYLSEMGYTVEQGI